MKIVRTNRRAAASVVMTVLAVVGAACVPPPEPAPPASTTTTSAPTTTVVPTTTTAPPTTTTTSTTTTTTSTTTTTTTTQPPSGPQHHPLSVNCRTSVTVLFFTETSDDVLDMGVTAYAPSTVPAGETFMMELTPDPIDVPSSAGSYTVQNLNTLRVRFNVPAGTTYVDAGVSGGSVSGATVGLVNGQVRMDIPGPLAGGTTAVLPTVYLTLRATGTPGQVIESRLAGSSYSNPGITFVARISGTPVGTVNGNANCYAPVNPTLTQTLIT